MSSKVSDSDRAIQSKWPVGGLGWGGRVETSNLSGLITN